MSSIDELCPTVPAHEADATVDEIGLAVMRLSLAYTRCEVSVGSIMGALTGTAPTPRTGALLIYGIYHLLGAAVREMVPGTVRSIRPTSSDPRAQMLCAAVSGDEQLVVDVACSLVLPAEDDGSMSEAAYEELSDACIMLHAALVHHELPVQIT